VYLFIDTETGGLTPRHSLLTLSCIGVDDKFQIIPTADGGHGLYLQLKHAEYAVTAGALSVNKIDLLAHDARAITLDAARVRLCTFIDQILQRTGKKRLVPAGHNVAFDVQFLRTYLLDEQMWDRYFTYPALDTASIARYLNAAGVYAGSYSLTKLCERFAPEAAGGNMHNAEIDNLVAIELAKKFVGLLAR
jgi:DNA polymerase III epsilon subunit-like protein